MSERGMQLREKQKVRYTYGILERQMRRYFGGARRSPGLTGDNLFQILERRLDNVAFRLGFAISRAQARQVVGHGHIAVNGRKVDIPSYLVKPGDVISWKEGTKKTELYKKAAEGAGGRVVPPWLSLDAQGLAGRVLTLPTAADMDVKFDAKLVVAYYAR